VPRPAKVVGKEPKSAPETAVKVTKVAKASTVKAVKSTATIQAKDSVKTTFAKAAKPEVAAPKLPVASAVTPVKVAAAPVAPATASVPVRAGRPSSRLAQLTVPSMAQSVASTAAKASFSQTIDVPYIVPPVASAVKKDPALVNNWKLKPVEQLTEAELIAMPDEEYMNDTQLAFFRRVLNTLKQDILSNAGQTTEHLRADTVVVPDPADRATIEEEHALELRTRDRERKLLKKIEQSLARIDSGDYGYCDETGEAIGVGRLLARPTANLSLEAQQRRELKQKMFGD
jgi:DnaK suppressor protein